MLIKYVLSEVDNFLCHKVETKCSGERGIRIAIQIFVPLFNETFFNGMPTAEMSSTPPVKVEASLL